MRNSIRRTGLLLAALILIPACAWAGNNKKKAADEVDEGWTTSVPTAAEDARKSGKLIMLDFTGSDWCHYCQELKKDVFSSDDFKKWYADKLVLVEVDFPNGKQQSTELKKQNDELKEKYKPTGYPTIVFVKDDGTEVGRMVGYGNAKDWSKEAADIVTKAQAKQKTK